MKKRLKIPKEYPYDCDLELKVSGTDPIYMVVNGTIGTKHLLTAIPDSNGIVKFILPEDTVDLTTCFDWTSDVFTEYNLNIPDGYGNRLLTIIGLNKVLNKFKIKKYAQIFWICDNLVVLDNPEYFNMSNCETIAFVVSGEGENVKHFEKIKHWDLTRWDTSKCKLLQEPIGELSNVESIDVSNWNVENVEHAIMLFYKTTIKKVDLSTWKFNNLKISNMGFSDYYGEELILSDGFDTSKCTNMGGFYGYTYNIKKYPKVNTSSAVEINNFIAHNSIVEKIDWDIDLSNMSYAWGLLWDLPNLKYAVIKNLGKSEMKSGTTTHSLCPNSNNWGAGSEENRKSLLDSLLTYSYDRAANNKSNMTITIGSKNLARLTTEEIAAVTAKGYTLT